jgi:hypothetical protein
MSRITLSDYFAAYAGHPGITAEHRASAEMLLVQVNALLVEIVAGGRADLDRNPKTGTLISGEKNGGWRPKNCTEGTENSSHKEGKGVDIYDADGDLDAACNDDLLARHGLYREHPAQTRGWLHLTNRAPRSGRRTFYA